MRRSGKTTRDIDSSIQTLFTEGKIYIPTKTEYLSYVKVCLNPIESIQHKLHQILQYVVVDSDYNEGFAQEDFRNRLIQRLKIEHKQQFEIEGRWIKLIK